MCCGGRGVNLLVTTHRHNHLDTLQSHTLPRHDTLIEHQLQRESLPQRLESRKDRFIYELLCGRRIVNGIGVRDVRAITAAIFCVDRYVKASFNLAFLKLQLLAFGFNPKRS